MTINNFKKLIPPSLGAVLSVDAPEPLWRAHKETRDVKKTTSLLGAKNFPTLEFKTSSAPLDWNEAQAYAKNLGAGWRLPSTAETHMHRGELYEAFSAESLGRERRTFVDVWTSECHYVCLSSGFTRRKNFAPVEENFVVVVRSAPDET
jgi:hypothetical protein